jgi:hypothetical protein
MSKSNIISVILILVISGAGYYTWCRYQRLFLSYSPEINAVLFMAGDLTSDSRDSRYWELLPEDFIVGKASVIRQSKDIKTGKRKWGRTLKTIQ